jgi:diguanylate cyclase
MSDQDFERSIGFGEIALKHLKKNSLVAYPRNYEFWYTYAAGFHKNLNEAVNESLKTKGSISADEVNHLYEIHLTSARLGDRIENVGTDLSGEIESVIKMIEQNLGQTSEFGDSLTDAASQLQHADNQKQVGEIVQTLTTATQQAVAENKALEQRLAESKQQIDDMQVSMEAIRNESLTDSLTTLSNRKHFDQSLERLMLEMTHAEQPLCLLMADIDHFKQFNDTFGHQTGDQVLRLVAMAIKNQVKGQDIPCRYGGEEFGIILPRTDLESAQIVAEHIRASVQAKELIKRSTGENLGRVTISLGISVLTAEDTVLSFIDRADRALYAAKDGGRNRVVNESSLKITRREVA